MLEYCILMYDGMVTPIYAVPQEGQQGEQKHEIPDHVKDINGTLYFSNVTAEDKGRYVCIATNSQGIINATIDIDVIGVCMCVCSSVFHVSINRRSLSPFPSLT